MKLEQFEFFTNNIFSLILLLEGKNAECCMLHADSALSYRSFKQLTYIEFIKEYITQYLEGR